MMKQSRLFIFFILHTPFAVEKCFPVTLWLHESTSVQPHTFYLSYWAPPKLEVKSHAEATLTAVAAEGDAINHSLSLDMF